MKIKITKKPTSDLLEVELDLLVAGTNREVLHLTPVEMSKLAQAMQDFNYMESEAVHCAPTYMTAEWE